MGVRWVDVSCVVEDADGVASAAIFGCVSGAGHRAAFVSRYARRRESIGAITLGTVFQTC